MRPGSERDRAFSRALAFAERAAEPKIGASEPALASSLYDRAASAAQSPVQQVTYRLSRARFTRAQRDFMAEVRLYQEILDNPAYRAVQVPSDDQATPLTAAQVAERDISERLRDYPAAYQPYEQAATAALGKARQANDAQQMLAVAQTYPNAKVAPQAMLAAAEVFEAAGKHRPATQVLNQLYRKYRDAADKPRVIEAQARNYLSLPGGVGIAIGRLNEGAKLPGVPQLTRPLKLPDGNTIENVSFGAAAELLQKYSAQLASATLPEFNIPVWSAQRKMKKPFLLETAETVIADVDVLVVPPRDLRTFARNDRVVTWTNKQGLSVYAVGTNTPLGTNSTITGEAKGCAWIGAELLVWTQDSIALLKGDEAGTLWSVALSALPSVDATPDEPEVAGAGGAGAGGQRQDPMIAQIEVQRRMARRRANFFPPAQAPQPQRVDGPERIMHVGAVADRMVLATSRGRVVALELSSGNVAWQTRVSEMPMLQFVTSDDFVAFRFVDERGMQIVALDTYAGQVVHSRAFTNESGEIPQNMALSPDGTLLYTLPNRLCAKDLYEPKKELKFGESSSIENNPAFSGMVGPEQLVVADGRVLAVSDNGQIVRVLSLEDGHESSNPLNTGANSANVWLRVVGSRLYCVSQRTACAYNLNDPDDHWPPSMEVRLTPNVRDAFIGKRHLVLLDQPSAPNAEPLPAGQPASHFRLLAYARYSPAGKTGESGKLDQDPSVTHSAGIDATWQPVDGGFYYRSLDRKLHFLRGSAEAN
jgi:hypothetical protein